MGITFPSVAGQERVIRAAYKRSNLDPNKTAFFECHGTGTPVGDPIEVRAVANAMNDTRSTEKPLLLGAVKSSIGHSGAASGIFAVMKAALSTENGMIPGVCGFKNLNPNIKEKEWNIKIQRHAAPIPVYCWPAASGPFRCLSNYQTAYRIYLLRTVFYHVLTEMSPDLGLYRY
ncbi:hypothetical protein LOZ58_005149 [Ophidiomyces ophidiicola]|nr:hypothetical protein LOZ65_006440 [Ophidiomyces ophidiicola]KAI1935094.1 hypothetical protein LOZ66_005399 [Ophidiomyces ophidiicola]KAI1958417.1 hypothetical protein LOZ58_005149 [Ophidiomyces ophidiicola]